MLRLVSIGFALSLVLGFSPAAQGGMLTGGQAPDIDTFMQIGYAGTPQTTRDGRLLLFTSNASGVNQLYRLDRVDGWPYQLTVFAEGVDFSVLSPTGEYAVVGVGWGGNENSQLFLVDVWTGATEQLTALPDVRHGAPTWSHDGRTLFFNSNEANGKDFFIYRLDLESREKSLLADIPGWNVAGDLSEDGRQLVVGHWDSNTRSELHLVDLDSGEHSLLTPEGREAVFTEARFSADGRILYLLTNDNPDGIQRRAAMDLASRRLRFLDQGGVWEVQSLDLSPRRDLMAWTVNEDGYRRLRLLDLDTEQPLPGPPVDGQVSGISFTDRNTLVFGFSSASSTSDIWLWDWKAPALEKITHSTYAGIDPSQFTDPQLVRYPSFDGLEIPAFLYLPPGRKPGEAVPFVIHMHGGPESQFTPSFIRHFQYLLLNGYGILAPNVRGSSGYGREYISLDDYRKRLDSVKDMKAGADWLIAEGYTASGMLAVKGGSYGGYMTMAGITEYPDLFSAAINDVGIVNFRSFLENTADYRRALREAEYGPLSDPEFLDSISPINKADRIRTPLMVVHGENDPRVPVGEARQIIDAVRKNGGVIEELIFPDEGHGVSKRPNVLTVYRRMVEFLDANLKGEAKAPGTE